MTNKFGNDEPATVVYITLLLLALLMAYYVSSTAWTLFVALILVLFSHLKK